jgi:hypothetical protein
MAWPLAGRRPIILKIGHPKTRKSDFGRRDDRIADDDEAAEYSLLEKLLIIHLQTCCGRLLPGKPPVNFPFWAKKGPE